MRDPARIQPMLDALGELWRQHPDLRLTQLLTAVTHGKHRLGHNPLFYIEDDELLEAIKAWE